MCSTLAFLLCGKPILYLILYKDKIKDDDTQIINTYKYKKELKKVN